MKWFVQIILGYLLADFLGGVFHWFEDTYLPYCTKVPFLSGIAKSNEMHHYYPRLIVNRKWYQNIYETFLITLTFFVIFCFTLSYKIWKNYWIFIFTLLIISTFLNILHKFAHMRDCETHAIVKAFQFFGLIQKHEYHAVHHEGADQRYCVLSVYLNPILDTIHFWRGVEHIILLVTGVPVKRKAKYSDYNPIYTKVHIESRKECPRLVTYKEKKELEDKLKKYNRCSS
jgi:ubiquitin-conjugating enzyme E2 variant